MSFVAMPGTRIGGYVVVSEIGRGGMAVVYLAEHPSLGRKVALKLLTPELVDDEAFRERFVREAHLAAGMEHPNIVPVYDAGEIEGLLFIAMRYVEGTDLERVLKREGTLSLDRSVEILSQISAALDAAHAKGLVHRDVKPSNVLIALGEGPRGGDHVYLADFGLARPQIGSGLTHAGELYGTLDYMAPEQLDGRPLDARTDVYSLACVAYECLTGEPPFRKESSLAKAAAHLHTRPTPPSELNSDLSTQVDEAILRGLMKDKSSRFEHAGQFATALMARPNAAEERSSTIAPEEKQVPAIPHEERKVVSVLAVAQTPDAGIDAEDWRAVLDRTTPHAVRVIERFGGMAVGSIAGVITGIFGVPSAHEDDAERAVRAGLRIIDEFAEPAPRIGVSTREALVSSGSREDGGPITGRVVADSAGSASAASPGHVMVDAETWALTRGAIDYEELQVSKPLIQGGEAVTRWRAIKPISRVGSRERDHSPFVGRDAELSVLIQLFDRSRSRPTTEFVTIIAEPGLGKSRLVRELWRHVDLLPEFVTWLEGRCLPYGYGISFWALGEIVKTRAGILETDDQPTISTKLDRLVTEPDPQTRTWIKDRLAPLVGLETSTEPPHRDEMFTAWRRFLEEIASAGPTVLVIEDLHWADEAFVVFLEHFAERTAGLPLLVVVTARPELAERHPSWPPGRHSTVLSLSPLSDEDLKTLITQTMSEADPELVSIVLERAGGSPLYAEQLAAMLRERELPTAGGALDETLIPQSVQALIAARIDALPPEPKRVLMLASVVGKTFWGGGVSSIEDHPDLEATLSELVRREFCRPVYPSTMENDREYTFWHALVRDVAYAELTKADRARMHAGTARWIAGRTAGAIGEDAEIIVHHLDAALDLATSAPDLDTDWIAGLLTEALLSAGRSAWGRGDVGQAATLLERATGLLPRDHVERVEVLRLLGAAWRDAGDVDRSVPIFNEAVALAIERGDPSAEWRIIAERFDATRVIDPTAPASSDPRRLIKDRIPSLEAEDDHFGLAKAWRLIALMSWDELQFTESEEATAKGVEEARLAGNEPEAAEILAGLALSDFYGPTPVEEALARGGALLEELRGNVRSEAFVLAHLGGVHGMQGSFEKGYELLDRAANVIEEAGIGRWFSSIPLMRAYIAYLAGDLRSSEGMLEPLMEEFGEDIEISSLYCKVLVASSRADDALRIVEGVNGDEGEVPFDKVRALLIRADVWRASGRANEAKTAAEVALDLLRSRDDAHLLPESRVCLALAERELGREQHAQRLLREGVDLYLRKGNIAMVGRTRDLISASG